MVWEGSSGANPLPPIPIAVGTLLRWYRSKVDPGTGLLKLATFLGHVDVSSTAVYLTITESLLREANRRFEGFAEPVLREGLSP